jgi:hypothetical protein
VHLFSLLVHVVHLFSLLGSCALVLTTGSCTLVRAHWFMSTCSHYCFMCTCSNYWFMLCTCSRPLDHVHLFSILVHVVHLFVPLGSWALVLTTVSCALVLTTGSCCTLVLAPWFMCNFSYYWWTSVQHAPVVRTSAHEPRGENKCTTWTSSELAPWFMCTCSHYCFMLYTCSCPLVHEHLFSLLFHVHLF